MLLFVTRDLRKKKKKVPLFELIFILKISKFSRDVRTDRHTDLSTSPSGEDSDGRPKALLCY